MKYLAWWALAHTAMYWILAAFGIPIFAWIGAIYFLVALISFDQSYA